MDGKEIRDAIERKETELNRCYDVPEYIRLIDELQELYREYKRPKTA